MHNEMEKIGTGDALGDPVAFSRSVDALVNPKGISAISPGLRGTSYPGWSWSINHNSEGVVAGCRSAAVSARPAAARGKFGCVRFAGVLRLVLCTQPRSGNADTTRVGVVGILKCEPKVAPAAQPWAKGWNLFGIH